MRALHSLPPLSSPLLAPTSLRLRDGRKKVNEIHLIQEDEKATAETKQLCLWFVAAVLSGSWSLASPRELTYQCRCSI